MAPLVQKYCVEVAAIGSTRAGKSNRKRSNVCASRYARLGLVNQAVMDGVQSQFETIGNAELIEDIVKVVFHGLLADEELLADFPVAKSLCHQLDDFLFAIAQERFFPPLAGFGRLLESVDHLGGHAIIEPNFAVVYLANTLEQQIARRLLQDHSPCAQAHRSHYVAVILRCR